MADSVLFDGVDDVISFSLGNFAGTGAFTLAAIFKHTTGDDQGVCGAHSGAFNIGLAMNMDSAGNVTLETNVGGTFDAGDPITTANGWVLLAISKAAGSSVPNVHIYRDPTWRHAALDGVVGNPTSHTGFEVGALDPGQSFLDGNILVAGAWDSELSNGTIETLTGGPSFWEGADEAWRLNAGSGITSFATGGSSSESSRVGTTVDTGDVPTWWSDGAVVEGPKLRVVRSGVISR